MGRTPSGKPVAAYRVSSRSFPNRDATRAGQSVRIVPRTGSSDATADSPYIAYECLLWNDRFIVVSNGTHTRPIFERLKAGNTPRDAMLSVLAGLDREFDQHDTPRLCGLVDLVDDAAWLGSVTASALAVVPVKLEAGQMAYVTTYAFPLPSPLQVDRSFHAESPTEACRHITDGSAFTDFERPICAAAAVAHDRETEIAVLNRQN